VIGSGVLGSSHGRGLGLAQDQLIPDEKLSVAFLMNIRHQLVVYSLMGTYDW